MTKPALRVFGFDDATCNDAYCSPETQTQTPKLSVFNPSVKAAPPAMVNLRVGDVVPVLLQSMQYRLAWIDDFRDDPIAISRDMYDVLLAFNRIHNAA